MKYVNISELRHKLLKYLTRVQPGEQINVTSRGALLTTVTPPINQRDAARAKLGKLAQTVVILDVVSPVEDNRDAVE